jgi:TonB family protein
VANTAQSAEHNDLARAVAPAVHGRAPILYLLSGDDALLLELGPLLGTRYRTHPIDNAEQIDPITTSPWALLIDATVRTDARAQAARVKQQYPLAPLLVICADGTTADWASPLARGALSAVIERSALSSAVFEAALASADLQLAASSAASAVEKSTPATPPKRPPLWLLIGLALLLLAPAVAYLLTGRQSGRAVIAAPARTAPPVVPNSMQTALAPVASSSPRTVLELLSDARIAFREGKSLLPATDGVSSGNSALELYAMVLAQDPQNEEARDGMRRLFAVASARIRADLGAGKEDEAARLLAAFRGVGIDPATIKALEAEIAAGRPRSLVAQARSALASGATDTAAQLISQLASAGVDRATVVELQGALDLQRATARLTELANRAHVLIKAGALLEPATDSAQSAVLSMQQLNRTNPLTLSTEHDLQAALLERTQTASRAGHFELAEQLLNAAAILGNGPELAAARTQLQNDVESTRAHAAAAAAAVTPPPVAESTPAAPDFVRAKPMVPLNVTYPQRAFDAGQQGYVIVEFTLDAKGRASDGKVIESNPSRVFDDAALQAVTHGRFDASALGAAGVAQRARIRIAFQPMAKQSAQ